MVTTQNSYEDIALPFHNSRHDVIIHFLLVAVIKYPVGFKSPVVHQTFVSAFSKILQTPASDRFVIVLDLHEFPFHRLIRKNPNENLRVCVLPPQRRVHADGDYQRHLSKNRQKTAKTTKIWSVPWRHCLRAERSEGCLRNRNSAEGKIFAA